MRLRRFWSLLLSFAIGLSFCACGNSNENKSTDQFQTDLQALVNEITFVNICCDYITNTVYEIWSNTSTDKVTTIFQAALLFDDAEKTPSEYADILPFDEGDIDILLYMVATALNPDVLDVYKSSGLPNGKFLGDGEQETIALCAQICTSYNNISEGIEHISETIKSFKNTYSDSHEEEVTLINEWYLESSLYADFSKTPSGTMRTYIDAVNEYQNNLARYQKTAEMYIES